MSPSIRDLYVYPVKSAAGIRVDRAEMGARGFELDRRWMIVDETGAFLSQRTYPALTLIEPQVTDEQLVLERPVDPADGPGGERTRLALPREPGDADALDVEIWGDEVEALGLGDEADRWLSSYLDTECALVFMPDSANRSVDDEEAGRGDQVSFADGYPYLLTSYASLRAVNERLDEAIAMNRFRPNIVVEGAEPFAEDRWGTIRVGGAEFRVAEPCLRCSVTTVDQATGETGNEPLQTLAEFRRTDEGVAFGQNLLARRSDAVAVGDTIDVRETKPPVSVVSDDSEVT